MDFIASIMKRPKSIATTGITSTQSAAMEASEAASPPEDLPSAKVTEGVSLISPHLSTLLESASEDLLRLEEQHCNLLMEPVPIPLAAPETNSASRETIQQLLSEINVNLNQVSANEMEHLQAMSGELSPLAVKPNPKPSSMEQQKALVAALGHQTAATGCQNLNVGVVPKFGGLPEFDETQIPELAPSSAEMEVRHSDSDVFVECLSLHSERYTADRSELEAYSSALNDVLEQQLSMTSAAALDNEIEDPLAVNQNDNVSYEAMDVDDISETMEMLKDVLGPEDHQLLQQHILSESQPVLQLSKQEIKIQETERPSPDEVIQKDDDQGHHQIQNPPLEEPEQPIQPQQPPNVQKPSELTEVHTSTSIEFPKKDQETSVVVETAQSTELDLPKASFSLEQNTSPAVEATEEEISGEEFEPMEVDVSIRMDEATELGSSRHPHVEIQAPNLTPTASKVSEENNQNVGVPEDPLKSTGLQPSEVPLPAAPLSPPIPTHTLQDKTDELGNSPPIPTHRPKTAEELKFLALKELPLPDDIDTESNVPPPIQEVDNVAPDEQAHIRLVAAVTPRQKRSATPLSLDVGGCTTEVCTPEPTSPSFPLKGQAEKPSHFPRSPHAPPEQEEMPYLEEAVIEPKQSGFGAGVIAKSAVVIEVTQSSPEKQQHLNETLPMEERSPSPLNETFDSGWKMEDKPQADYQDIEGSSTYAVSLGSVDDHQRRTFSVIQSTADTGESKAQQTIFKEKENARRTFCLEQNASPAMEATEDAMGNDAMDLDVSLRVNEVTIVKTPQKIEKESQAPISNSPPIPTHQHLKRAPIHGLNSPVSPLGNATVVLEEQALSAKEQATLSASDEKDDVFVEHFGAISPVSDDMFKTPQFTSSSFNNQAKMKANGAGEMGGKAAAAMNRQGRAASVEEEAVFDAQFQDGASNQNLILNSLDFDYLYTKGSNNAPIDRSSLLLKFDPLLGAPVPVNHPSQQEQALLNILGSNQNRILSPTLEEHETSGGNQSFGIVPSAKDTAKKLDFKPPVDRTKKHVKMSVDVIDNDCNKTFDNSNLNTEDKTHSYNNMDELEKKIKNEVTRSEDIEKKLKEGEQREEALIKRITEKDKTNAKLNGVIEAYEKAIAELISEKEQQAQLHERQLQEVQADRDANYHHLTSLETTFSDLHVKYEKSKEMTSQLKSNEETLLAERKQMMDNLRLQEQRYDKMKNHAMQQLEIANKKLDTYAREHADESKKLKALLKKEEISRVSMTEQLQQKSRENADLLKICEELIYGKGQDF
ncbi:uncharacterized protein LOC108114978 isoform X2 [Drosophila eugracilis]|uniref:uncharacterized protein LOC108114978 isoform X2 n=1 Tax=Drosophila eugracilis TaxID=29029 RepID=UPI001BDB26B7|nr:uncharacterized protein LOC108114978 isoform X2 [Drosophila eugracilis]